MKRITAVLDDSWYVFDNFIEICWQSMTLSLYTVSVWRILFYVWNHFLSKSMKTLFISQQCVWPFIKHQRITCTMYIPIKNVKLNRNLQCRRKYNCTLHQFLLLYMYGPSFLIDQRVWAVVLDVYLGMRYVHEESISIVGLQH